MDPSKRTAELEYARQFLQAAGFELSNLRLGEDPPDVRVTIRRREVAIELTQYHSPERGPKGHTRKQVEQEWFKLRERIEDVREKCYSGLATVSCLMFFRSLLLPSRDEHREFAEELWTLVHRYAHETLADGRQIWLMDLDPKPPLLHRYLSHVSLSRCREYGPVGWNHDVAGVGLSEEALLCAVRPKLRAARPADTDEFWLLVYGGPMMSERLQLRQPEELRAFHCLETHLQSGPFDRVYLFVPGWNWLCEWSKRLG